MHVCVLSCLSQVSWHLKVMLVVCFRWSDIWGVCVGIWDGLPANACRCCSARGTCDCHRWFGSYWRHFVCSNKTSGYVTFIACPRSALSLYISVHWSGIVNYLSERVGAEVVECGCVIGLPEDKVKLEQSCDPSLSKLIMVTLLLVMIVERFLINRAK